MMRRRVCTLVLCTLMLSALPLAARSEPSVESELLGYINGGRHSTLLPHAGLLSAARGHSHEMGSGRNCPDSEGCLNHDGAEGRISGAAPDPSEATGAPDDGFSGMWCENVAYVSGAPANEVAQRMYAAWTESASHNRCMNAGEMTVAGLGVYHEGKRWWATLELAVDRTAPGSSAGIQPAGAAPASAPQPARATTSAAAKPAPSRPVDQPQLADLMANTSPSAFRTVREHGKTLVESYRTDLESTTKVASAHEGPASRLLAAPTLPVRDRHHIVWPDLLGTIGALVLVAEVLRRLSRRPEPAPDLRPLKTGLL